MIHDVDPVFAPVQWAPAAVCQTPLQIAVPPPQAAPTPVQMVALPAPQLVQPAPQTLQLQPAVMVRQVPTTPPVRVTPQMSPFVMVPGHVPAPVGWAPTVQYIALPSPNPTLFATPLSSPVDSIDQFEDAEAPELVTNDDVEQDIGVGDAHETAVVPATRRQNTLRTSKSDTADAPKLPIGTCGHNSWDNVRAVRRRIVLRCRVCQAQTCTLIDTLAKEPKCEKFAKEGTCPEGHACPKFHLHHRKQGLNERVAVHGRAVLANVNKNSDHLKHLTEVNRRKYLDASGGLLQK